MNNRSRFKVFVVLEDLLPVRYVNMEGLQSLLFNLLFKKANAFYAAASYETKMIKPKNWGIENDTLLSHSLVRWWLNEQQSWWQELCYGSCFLPDKSYMCFLNAPEKANKELYVLWPCTLIAFKAGDVPSAVSHISGHHPTAEVNDGQTESIGNDFMCG